MAMVRLAWSQFSGEGLVQQRLLQRLQRSVLPLVEAGEALGFFVEGVELGGDCLLVRPRRNRQRDEPQIPDVNLHQRCAVSLLTDLALNRPTADEVETKLWQQE